jgi:hypothetical protein
VKFGQAISAAALLLAGLAASNAHAALFMTVPETSTPYVQYGNDGFLFTPTTNLIVDELDYYVSPFNSDLMISPHGVAIYSVSDTSTPLVQTVIFNNGTIVSGGAGSSSFESVAVAPTLLTAGDEYMLAGFSTPDDFENGGDPYGNGIPLGSLVVSNATLSGYYYDYSGVLDYPTTPYPTAFVGPNFEAGVVQTSAVPEISTWAMMLIGFGLVGMQLKRRGVSLSA